MDRKGPWGGESVVALHGMFFSSGYESLLFSMAIGECFSQVIVEVEGLSTGYVTGHWKTMLGLLANLEPAQ